VQHLYFFCAVHGTAVFCPETSDLSSDELLIGECIQHKQTNKQEKLDGTFFIHT